MLLPQTTTGRAVTSWVRGTISALRAELGVALRAAIAGPVAGLAEVNPARVEVDRVLESAERHPILGQVTSLAEARTTVLLDEIVTLVGTDQRLVDPRIRDLGAQDPVLAQTLRAYLDAFGDIGAAARSLQVHPNTVRYRIRRIEQLLSTSLGDPDVRLLFRWGCGPWNARLSNSTVTPLTAPLRTPTSTLRQPVSAHAQHCRTL